MTQSERRVTSRKIRVLIVDDDDNFLFALTTLLETDERLEVVAAAANGEQALRYAKLLRPEIVTMDIEMPIMDGVEATKQSRSLDHAPASSALASGPRSGRASLAPSTQSGP
jgi:two-component system chemotaxis response regulator CheB